MEKSKSIVKKRRLPLRLSTRLSRWKKPDGKLVDLTAEEPEIQEQNNAIVVFEGDKDGKVDDKSDNIHKKNIQDHSDNDFQTPPPPTVKVSMQTRSGKRKREDKIEISSEKGKKTKDILGSTESTRKAKNVISGGRKKSMAIKKKNIPTEVEYLRTRQSPYQLVNLCRKMSEKKKKVIDKMRFGGILKCQIDSIPSRLAYWVVDHFDPDKMEMQIGLEKIKITSENVHKLLGFPMGKIKVETVKRAGSKDTPMVATWRRQFSAGVKGPQVITVKQIITQIINDKNTGDLFKLNTLVLIMTLMAEGVKCGTVNQKFLPFIKNIQDIHEMDWCGYVIECLATCKKKWKKDDKKSWFTGPLLLLLVWCVTSVRIINKEKKLHEPAVAHLTMEMLKDVEKKIIHEGGKKNVSKGKLMKGTVKAKKGKVGREYGKEDEKKIATVVEETSDESEKAIEHETSDDKKESTEHGIIMLKLLYNSNEHETENLLNTNLDINLLMNYYNNKEIK